MQETMFKRIIGLTAIPIISASICLSGNAALASDVNVNAPESRAGFVLESVKQSYTANLRSEAIKANKPAPSSAGISDAGLWLKKVIASDVNMVTNRIAKTSQTPVVIDGKTYFTAGDSYVFTIRQNNAIRFAKDPTTNKSINKADAVIYADASGMALYFESEDSYRNFISLANQDTVFGYSRPR